MSNIAAIFKSDETRKAYNGLSDVQKVAYQARTNWLLQAHPHQIMPSGEWFSIWLMLAGRGCGKNEDSRRTDLVVGMGGTQDPLAGSCPYII